MTTFREWLIERLEKLNPAQPSVQSSESEAPPESIRDFKTAYEEIDVVTRAIELMVSACTEVPFLVKGGAEKKLTKLLNTRPNPFEDRIRFYRRAFMDYMLDGNVFFFYDQQDQGDSLYIIPANDVTIIADKKRFVAGYEYAPGSVAENSLFGSLGRISPNRGERSDQIVIQFTSREIIHVKADSADSIYRGDSRLKRLERLVEIYYAMIDFQRQFFENGAIPGFVLTTDNVLSKKIKDRLLDDWKMSYTSIYRGARSPAILDGGLKIDRFSTLTFAELDFENSIDRIQQDISKALGVPYVLLKSGNNANVGVNQVLLYLHTILPILDQFASAFSLRFGPDIEVIPDKKSISALRPDTRSQAMFWSTLVNGGIATPDEAREDLRLNKMGGECEHIRVPVNVAGSATNPAVGGRPPQQDVDGSDTDASTQESKDYG